MADKQSPLALRLRQCLFDFKFEDLEDRTLSWPQRKGRADYLRRTSYSVIIEQKDIHVNDKTSFMALTKFTDETIKKNKQNWKNFDIVSWNSADTAYYLEVITQARKRFGRRFREANRQVRETREVLSLPSSYGMVLVVNQFAGNLNDGLCCSLMGEILEDRKDNGELLYPDIDGSFYIQNLQERKTYDGKDSIFFSMLRNVPKSALMTPLVKEIYDKFYPGAVDLQHPSKIFT